MSYDIELRIDTGGEYMATVMEVGNYTYNVSKMFFKALGHGLTDLDGKLCADSLPNLERAVKHMQENPDEYTPLNPENGWGNYDGALSFLTTLKVSCQQHPKATIYVY